MSCYGVPRPLDADAHSIRTRPGSNPFLGDLRGPHQQARTITPWEIGREWCHEILERAAAKTNLRDRVREQREALQQFRERLDAMPAAERVDGLTNRDSELWPALLL